jgi:flagellar basal-body rod protein FlgB
VSSFARTLDLLNRAMDVGMLRNAVYADNLANQNVPNFKRTEVNFEAELEKALNSQNYKPGFEMTRNGPRHISSWTQIDYRTIEPRRVLDYLSTYNNNGNNVDPEVEANLILKNQLRYTLFAQAAAFEYSQVNMVLRP